jgi:gliding motility-associated lipoprotein GldH
MRHLKSILFIFSFLSLMFTACVQETIVDLNQDVGDAWTKDKKIVFDYDIKDSINPVDFYVNIRNTTDYEYANIFFFIKTTYPDRRYSIDTVEFFLADAKGEWLGKGLGKLRNRTAILKKDMRFPMKGHYRMEFEMAMRDSVLNGIDAIGIRVVPHEEE